MLFFTLKDASFRMSINTEVFTLIQFKAVKASDLASVIKMLRSNISLEEMGMIPNLNIGSNA